MTRTYYKNFFGTNEAVEMAIRKFDEVFRRMYNVYGGKRENSYKAEDGEYNVVMSYTANWVETPFLPEYSMEAIERRYWKETYRFPHPHDGNFSDTRAREG